MPETGFSHIPKLRPDTVWLICMLLSLSATSTHCNDALDVPQGVMLSSDKPIQQLSVSWLGGAARTFDLIILRIESQKTVFNETIVTAPQENGQHLWKWTSTEPLECTSLSVRLRARDGQKTSDWSDIRTVQGEDHTSQKKSRMFPQDRVVMVGSNTTLCCIVGEGKGFGTIRSNNTTMKVAPLSRRSYATTKTNQAPSTVTGTNVFCESDIKMMLTGTVIFVGYPPRPTDLACETRDLTSVLCEWSPGNTHLFGSRRTSYKLNGRRCDKADRNCRLPEWAGNWTLVAKNDLGQATLSYSAQLTHRVHPVAPVNLTVIAHAWNATVLWAWDYPTYDSLALTCQVQITSEGHTKIRTFSGVGLRSVALLDLVPVADYHVSVNCCAQQHFWKWGPSSKTLDFTTNIDVPEAPALWVSLDNDNIGTVMWKPLTLRQSHGEVTGYELTLWSPEYSLQHTETLEPGTHEVPINLTHMRPASKFVATLMAKNLAGVSPPASVAILMSDVEPPAVSRVAGTAGGGLHLSWASDANASSGYVVEWRDACCLHDCPVGWIKMATGTTNVSIAPAATPDASELLQRWQGYTQELIPFRSVRNLMTNQENSDIQLTWREIPLAERRGYLLGYRVYLNTGPQLTLIANLSDPHSRSYTVKNLRVSSYKFTVKAYTSAGEDAGSTASITMESYTDWLLLEILASLGTMTCFLFLVTFICYKKRKWVKKAFYPDIPEPKLAGDWSRTQGPLDVKPHANSMVHIVEETEWDSSKEKLVVIPEEDEDEEQAVRDEPVDTDEPMSIRYYSQVVGERPIRPRYPHSAESSGESSASSLDSARTDVTYTGIQTSGSSLTFQAEPPFPHDGQPPQGDFPAAVAGGAGGYRPQVQPAMPGPGQDPGLAAPQSFPEPQPERGGAFGGYKPQCSWQMDSSGEADEGSIEASSMGSPTSVASTQFLLPQEDEQSEGEGSSSATTWLHNLLSSTKS
ncbi:hypothetical protein CRUP_012436 [Coryphaenoides rupestris]|nr:hypothetical protein CRUP_012436 [Coryphaenoides rupestris]